MVRCLLAVGLIAFGCTSANAAFTFALDPVYQEGDFNAGSNHEVDLVVTNTHGEARFLNFDSAVLNVFEDSNLVTFVSFSVPTSLNLGFAPGQQSVVGTAVFNIPVNPNGTQTLGTGTERFTVDLQFDDTALVLGGAPSTFDNVASLAGTVNAIPEPSSLGLVGLAVVGLVGYRRRRA